MKKYLLSLAALAILMFGSLPVARAQSEITLIAPGGVRAPLNALVPAFERKTGYKVKMTIGSGLGTKKQVMQGEAFDVPIVEAPVAEVIATGNVVASTEAHLADAFVGIAVRKGAPKPDISTPEAVKKLLLAAKSITYPDPAGGAAAGVSFTETLKKLGIADEIQSKLTLAHGGANAMERVAQGETEIGLTFVSEMKNPGIDIVGPLPREISTPTLFVGYVSAHAKDPAAAKQLLEFLSSPDAAAAYQEDGMQPGR